MAQRARSPQRGDAASKRVKGGAGEAKAAADVHELTTINGSPYPKSWPRPGEDIDLAVHDLPHEDADTEWW